MTSIKNFFLTAILCFPLALMAQEGIHAFRIANNTPHFLESDVSISGNETKVTTGLTSISRWALAQFHVIDFPLGFHHTNDPYLFVSDQTETSDDDSHGVITDISISGESLFSIVYSYNESAGTALYNIVYSDGTAGPQYDLMEELGNSPHMGEQEIMIDGKSHRLYFGTHIGDEEDIKDVLFVLDEKIPESLFRDPDFSELSDPTVLNILTYNPGILTPVGVNDHEEAERALVFHNSIPDNFDIIIFQEFFEIDDEVAVIFSHLDSVYPYRSDRLNLPANDDSIPGIGPVAKDGGVYILSHHPILYEEDISYQFECGVEVEGVDAFADKGVKYVRIDKLGTTIHVFGTHTYGRAVQEVPCATDFILDKTGTNSQDIVIIGGDFNYHYNGGDYSYMRSHFKVIEPNFISYDDENFAGSTWLYNHYSSFTGDGNYIDFIMPLKYGRHPLYQDNETQVYRNRTLHAPSWGVSDLGDHNPVAARLVFPVVTEQTNIVETCLGTPVGLSVTVNGEMEYQWFKDGIPIDGAITPNYAIDNVDFIDAGNYQCSMRYFYQNDSLINQIPMAYHGGYYAQGKLWDTLYSDIIPVEVFADDLNPVISMLGDTLFSSFQTGNQWYDQNGPVEGATDPFIIPEPGSDYYVVVSFSGCTADTSAVFQVSGIEDFFSNGKIKLYPTLTSGEVVIQNDLGETLQMKIYSINGEMRSSYSIESGVNHVNMNPNSPGTYLVSISDKNGAYIAGTTIILF